MKPRNPCPVCRRNMREAALQFRIWDKRPGFGSDAVFWLRTAISYRERCRNPLFHKGIVTP